MRCFVINLDHATDRLGWMTGEFDRLGIAFVRFPAIDKSTLDMDVVERLAGPPGSGWAIGQIACFFSHMELWKRIAAGDDAYGAIFEDDVHFSADAEAFLRDSLWIPGGVDLIKLETTLIPVRLSRADHVVIGHRLHALRGYHNGAAGYIVSKEGAARLLAKATTIDRPIDDFIFDRGYDSTCRQIVPALCVQDMLLPAKLPFLASNQIIPSSQTSWRPRAPLRIRLTRETKRLWHQMSGDHGAPVPIETWSASSGPVEAKDGV